MPSRRISSPVKTFEHWLAQQIEQLPASTRIASENELARMFHLSTSTVKRTLKRFVNRRLLYRLRGSGTYTGPADNTGIVKPLPPRRSAAETLAVQVGELISDGTLKNGAALPDLTYIKNRFSVSTRTVTESYRLLAQQGRVRKVGKRYWVGSFASMLKAGKGKTVYVASMGNKGFERSILMSGLEKMEIELQNNGFRVSVITADDIMRVLKAIASGADAPYGVVFHYFDNKPAFIDMQQQCFRYLGKGRRIDLPLIANIVNFKAPPGSIATVNMGNIDTVVARTIAAFLCEKKRQKVVAFISESDGVLSFERCIKLCPELGALTDGMVFRAVITDAQPRMQADRMTSVHSIKTREWLNAVLSKYRKMTSAGIDALFEFYRSPEDAFAAFAQGFCWIFPSAHSAARGWMWARANGISVPGDCSIIALENTSELMNYGITCCVPDWGTIGYLMAHEIMGDFPVARSHSGSINMKAIVLERNSTIR